MTPATNLKEITKTLYGWSSFQLLRSVIYSY